MVILRRPPGLALPSWSSEVMSLPNLEAVVLNSTDPEFDVWKARYEGRAAGPVPYGGRWYVPRERQRQRAPRGASATYKFLAEPVGEPPD
jgi:hypothetical protein